jgi:predicted aspartyl protease
LAHEGPQGIATLADGPQREQQSVIVDTVTIGSHVLHDVLAGVSPDGSPMLLGLPVLNKIGRFTIDGANRISR